MTRKHSFIDRWLISADSVIRTLHSRMQATDRVPPAANIEEAELSTAERKHIAGLMRINHAGEVCAQALYKGQALTARSEEVRIAMQQSAQEEEDHLNWCAQRLEQLDSHTSYLNPIWYSLSFGIGAAAGIIGDKLSLGFVAATEKQVCKHLNEHLQSLPEQDHKSRAILETMLEDEFHHAETALAHGGIIFPDAVQKGMTGVSKFMTTTTYHL